MISLPIYETKADVFDTNDPEIKNARIQLHSIKNSKTIKKEIEKFPQVKIVEEGTVPAKFCCHEYAAFHMTQLKSEELNEKALSAIYTMGYLDRNNFLGHFEPTDSPQIGDLVVYYNKETPQAIKFGWWPHSGVFMGNNIVKSTWGDSGFVFEHPLFMVPNTFGNSIRYYKLQKYYTPSDLYNFFSN